MSDRRTIDVTVTSPTSPPRKMSVVLAHVVHWSFTPSLPEAPRSADGGPRLEIHLSNGEILQFEADDATSYRALLQQAFGTDTGAMAPRSTP